MVRLDLGMQPSDFHAQPRRNQPSHCLSKKWLKIWTSHTSVWKWELGSHTRLVLSFGDSQITASERSGEPQWLRATPGSVHMDFSWHCHLPQAPWDRIAVPLSSLSWATAFMWQSLYGPWFSEASGPEQQLYLYPLNPSPRKVKIQPNIRAAQPLGTPKWTMCCSYQTGSQKKP